MSEKVKITVKPNGAAVVIPRKSHFAMAPIEMLVFRVKPNNLCQK